MNSENLKMKFSEFEVNFIYGFIMNPFDGNNEDKQFENLKSEISHKSNELIRDGWISHYPPNIFNNELVQWVDFNLKIHYPNIIKFYIEKNGKDKNLWPESASKIEGTVLKTLTVCKDGIGTITLTFRVNKTVNNHFCYNTADILRLLLSVPKNSHQTSKDYTKIKLSETLKLNNKVYKINLDEGREISERWDKFSVPFKMFVSTLINDLPKYFNDDFPEWNIILTKNKHDTAIKNIKTNNNFNLRIEDFALDHDPQVPYMYIVGKMHFNKFKNAFMEKGINNLNSSDNLENNHNNLFNLGSVIRKDYSQEIAAILGRWLNEQNIKIISKEFCEFEHLVTDGVFINQYVNSLIFLSFTGIVTLSIVPDFSNLNDVDMNFLEIPPNNNNKMIRLNLLNKPIEITRSSILRCLELSRMRWHHAFWLNRSLENLIHKTFKTTERNKFISHFAEFIEIETMIATHLENPNSNLWDATVGSNLSEYLHSQVISNIEYEIKEKLKITRELLNDRLNNLSLKKYIRNESNNS